MFRARLGVNLGFATNRYPEVDDWARIVGAELGLKSVKFVADLCSMFYPQRIIDEEIVKVRNAALQYGFGVDFIFTAAFTRVNHVCHPNPKIREEWVRYLMRLAETGAKMGARIMGSHFGILSMRDYADEARRREMTAVAIGNWHRIAIVAKGAGLESLMFEPMSVPREFPCTIKSTRELLEKVNQNIAIPMKLCIDVDHGYSNSGDPRDIDPYAWLTEFGADCVVVHLKQSTQNKSGHWAFTSDKNSEGIIDPERLLKTLEKSGAKDVTLILELSWRERYPADYQVISDLKQSVAYWRKYVKD